MRMTRAFTFHGSGYLPAVGRPSRWGLLFPLGPVTTGRLCEAPGPARIAPLCESSQAAPGFPECPEKDSNLLIPTWRASTISAVPAKRGRPQERATRRAALNSNLW